MSFKSRIHADYEIEERESLNVKETPADEAENLEYYLPDTVPTLHDNVKVRGDVEIGWYKDTNSIMVLVVAADPDAGINEPIGYLRLYKSPKSGYIVAESFLKKEHRKMGLGLAMYEYAARSFKKLISDRQVSKKADAVYPALKGRFNVYVATKESDRHVVMDPASEKALVESINKHGLHVATNHLKDIFPFEVGDDQNKKYAIGPHSTVSYVEEDGWGEWKASYEPIDKAVVQQVAFKSAAFH